MPIRSSRVPNQEQSIGAPGWEDRTLLHGLNQWRERQGEMDNAVPDSTPFRFIDHLRTFEAAYVRYGKNPKDLDAERATDKAQRAMNRLLAAFVLTPILVAGQTVESERHWEMTWGQRRKRTNKSPLLDFSIIDSVVRLAQSGRLDALRQCAQCGKWLLRRFAHQRFCSAACKEHFHRSDPADKTRRREWARHNYQLHKTKNVK